MASDRPRVYTRATHYEATCPICGEYRADTGKRDIVAWAKNHTCSTAPGLDAMAEFADLDARRKGTHGPR
jgi:hypothetical protein